MNFEFQPWERLSGAVTDGAADACVEVEGRKWLYRKCGPFHWVRPLDKPVLQWNYWLYPLARAVSSSALGTAFWEQPYASNLTEFLGGRNRTPRFERVWKLKQGVLLAWNPRDRWNFYCSSADSGRGAGDTAFELSQPLSVATEPASTVWRHLQRDWQNPDSDLFALAHFLDLPQSERALYFVRTRTGTPQQFVALMKTALRAFYFSWPSDVSELTLQLNALGLVAEHFRPDFPPSFGIRERAIIGHLVRAFKPGLTTTPASLLPWQATWLEITTSAPSQHEQLEAALELRAWLETHWPDGVRHLGKVV